jgi:hypothetical protein
VVNGITLKVLKDMQIKEAKAVINSCQWIYPIMTSQEVRDTINIKGMTYKVEEVGNLSFGNFSNLEAVIKANKETPYAALPKILGILLNNEKEQNMYNAVFSHIQKDSLNWDAKEVVPLINFTLTQGIRNLENTLPYLEHQRRELTLGLTTKLVNLEIALTASTIGSGTITGGMRRLLTWPAILLIRLMLSQVIKQAKPFIS